MIQKSCGHILTEPKTSKSFMCGAFTEDDRKMCPKNSGK